MAPWRTGGCDGILARGRHTMREARVGYILLSATLAVLFVVYAVDAFARGFGVQGAYAGTVFLAGVVTGATALQLHRLRVESRILGSEAPLAEFLVRQLDARLSLTEEQEREVRQTVVDSRAEVMRLDLGREVDEIFERSQQRIRRVLSPSQREAYDRLVEERRRIMRIGRPPK